jgi:ribosome modulation factor
VETLTLTKAETDRFQEAYTRGYAARKSGQFRHDNPFTQQDSFARSGWDRGWITAGKPVSNPCWYYEKENLQ